MKISVHRAISTWKALPVITIICALTPLTTHACGKGQQQVFTCKTKNNKVVEICNAGKDATYSFGRAGVKPELFLRQPKSALEGEYTGGSGSETQWVSFRNNKTSYHIFFDKWFWKGEPGDANYQEGGASASISVEQNGRDLATIECRPDSIEGDLIPLGLKQI